MHPDHTGTITLETPDQRLHRQAAYFRALADLSMTAACLAGQRLQAIVDAHNQARAETANTPPTLPDSSKPASDLSRATRDVIAVVRAENALFAPASASRPAARTPAPEPPRAAPDDPRRPLLREALHNAIAEPDPAQRRKKRAAVDTAVEETLLADPDKQTPIITHLKHLATSLHITLVPAKLSDAVLGMPPRVYNRNR